MSTTTTLPPDLTSAEKLHALMNRIYSLRADRDAIETQIFDLCTQVRNLGDDRPFWHCRRCGYDWRGHFPHRPPRQCPRCHSCGWMEDPVLATARRPSDAPNPKWGKRRNRGGGSRGRLAVGERVQSRGTDIPNSALPPPASTLTPPPQYEEIRTSLVPEPAVRFAEAPAAPEQDGDTSRRDINVASVEETTLQPTVPASSGAAADGAHQPENESVQVDDNKKEKENGPTV